MFQIRVALGISICFVCISKAASDDDPAVRLRSLQNTLAGRRRMRPLPRKSEFENVIVLDEQSILDDNNKTLIDGDQRTGDYDTNVQGYSNSLSLSMSYSLSVSSTNDSKKAKKSKTSKSSDAATSPSSETTTSKKSKSSKASPAEPPDDSTSPPSSKKSKGSKKSKSKSSKAGVVGVRNRIYKGRYIQLREYKKSCSSSGSCNQTSGNFCKGGIDVVQDFEVPDFGNVTIHLDIAWDFAGRRSKCAPVSRNEETLLGLGWLPLLSNSYVCYAESVYRIPKSHDSNEHVFASTFQVTMQDGQVLDGQILSGAVCELYSTSDKYLEMNSYIILGSVPGYSVYVRYVIDERTVQVVEFLSGAHQVSIQQEGSSSAGYLGDLRPDLSLLQGL